MVFCLYYGLLVIQSHLKKRIEQKFTRNYQNTPMPRRRNSTIWSIFNLFLVIISAKSDPQFEDYFVNDDSIQDEDPELVKLFSD